MAQPKEALKPLPGAVPAEWTPHKCMWTAWPSAADLWLENLEPARGEVATMVKLLAEGEKMKVLAHGDDAMASAKRLLGDSAEIIPGKFGDIWLRDTGPIFVDPKIAVRFQTNGWGGKYDLEHDDTVGDEVANHEQATIQRHNFILEGGALEHDGEGTILTTRQCLLNPNRNKGWTERKTEDALKSTLGARKILWLDDGMLNDHTDGHIDNIARFIGPATVACQIASGSDDPNARIFEDIANALSKMTDAAGRKLNVIGVPSPGRYENEDGDVVPASHMNFIIGNRTVAVPTYGSESAHEAVKILQSRFIHHRVVGLDSRAVLTGGGSFHCITQQVPQ